MRTMSSWVGNPGRPHYVGQEDETKKQPQTTLRSYLLLPHILFFRSRHLRFFSVLGTRFPRAGYYTSVTLYFSLLLLLLTVLFMVLIPPYAVVTLILVGISLLVAGSIYIAVAPAQPFWVNGKKIELSPGS